MKAPIHLNALRAFEASARHGSFSAAASELNVTPAAVGQLVRSLEDWLGTPLFVRSTSGRVRLGVTQVARRALPSIQAGFDKLTLGVATLRDASQMVALTVTVSPAFAAKWLLPRIDKFQAEWPDMDVRLDTSQRSLDFVTHGIDIGVRYGAGTWPGLAAERLKGEEIYPVCSPDLLKQITLRRPADLAGQTLIHDMSLGSHEGFPSWDTWLEKAGVIGVATERGLRINNSAAVLQASIEGHGIALGRSVMANDDILAGRLVRLFPQVHFDSALAYYVVYRAECLTLPRLAAFRSWLFREADA